MTAPSAVSAPTDRPANPYRGEHRVLIDIGTGDRDPKYPDVYAVAGVGPKNLSLDSLTGGQGVKCPAFFTRTATEAEVSEAFAKRDVLGPAPVLGSVVRARLNAREADALCVVVGVSPTGKFKVAKLGGDGNRSYTGVPQDRLTVVPVSPAGVLG